MKVSYKWLGEYFDKKLPAPADVAELLNAHAFEVEGMEQTAGDDTVLDIKVLPDRAHYALSHKGIAREIAAITATVFKGRDIIDVSVSADAPAISVKIIEEKLCSRYMARRITDVTVSESSPALKASLEAVGARSINNVVDATNFVMLDTGQPLHAFDADKIQGGITVRAAKAGEKIVILDGREVALVETDLVIADELGPLAIAGVKGGKRAEVTTATKNIILESACFDPSAIRRTATRTNLRNDSSKRFENGITSFMAADAMRQVSALITASSPNAHAGPITDIYPKPVKPWAVTVDPAYMNAISGLNLSVADMSAILIKLGCSVSAQGSSLVIVPPFARLDLILPEDIADELVRMYGYDKLPAAQTPDVPAVAIDPLYYQAERLKNILVGLGFSETLLYTLVPKGAFEISYPLANDKAALRESLAPKLIEALEQNAANAALLGLDTIQIFEVGNVFPKSGEKASLAIGVLQVKKKKGVTSESILKGAVAAFEAQSGMTLKGKIEIKGATAGIEVDIVAGKAGTLADLHFAPLTRDIRYKPFSKYPFIVRDIAVFVPSGTADADVSTTIKNAAIGSAKELLVKGPDLFDRFEKDGKVSYAFRMIFQSFDKTLSDEEVNAHMTAVYDAVKAKSWETR